MWNIQRMPFKVAGPHYYKDFFGRVYFLHRSKDLGHFGLDYIRMLGHLFSLNPSKDTLVSFFLTSEYRKISNSEVKNLKCRKKIIHCKPLGVIAQIMINLLPDYSKSDSV